MFKNTGKPYTFGQFKADFGASIVVFLVSLPLNLGIALAAGAPPIWGLLSAVVAGIGIGAISGSPLRVSGPADSGMAFVAAIISQVGIQAVGLITLIAGLIQFIAGRLGLGQWFRAVPPSVIQGMLSGIGILIVTGQFHALMDSKPQANALANLLTIPDLVHNLTVDPNQPHYLAALGLGLVSLLVYMFWNSERMPHSMKRVPAALIAVLIGTIFDLFLHLPVKHLSFPPELLASIPIGNAFAQWNLLLSPTTWNFILGMAFILSAESLIDAVAIDKMVPGHRSRYNWDLSAQGLGNMFCGFLGTMPTSGVIVRSVTNVKAGAVTRFSCVLMGTWILIAVLFGQSVLALIPMTCLSAVLLYVGFKLINFTGLNDIIKLGKGEVLIYVLTMATVAFHDILSGILVGIVLTFAKTLYIFSHLSIKVVTDPDTSHHHVYLNGAATFVRLPQLVQTLEDLPQDGTIHIHLENVRYIDHACFEMLSDWKAIHENQGATLLIDWDTLHQKQRPNQAEPLEA